MAAAVGNPRNVEQMEAFWSSLPSRLKSVLYKESRRLILSSDNVPLHPSAPSRIRALPKYLLFNDIFVIVQNTTMIEYPLDWVWLDHLPSSCDPSIVNNFCLILPETTIELQCKELAHKSMWISCIINAIGMNLKIPQFITSRGDLTLDTQLQLIKARDSLEYTYVSDSELKDGRYKGPWLNAKPHGLFRGEFWHEPSGKLYKGTFKKGKFHGSGELLWFTDKEYRKKYIGEFMKGYMHGNGQMKYSNGDVYDGTWSMDCRSGYGTLEESSRRNSKYTGAWKDDKRNGYGVYDDKMRYERYLGTWVDNHPYGPGMIVTSTGIYCETTFTGGVTNSAISSDGLILDPNGSSFMGKIAPGFKLAGKGTITLSNGISLDGVFSGAWHGPIEIQRGVLDGHCSISNSSHVRTKSNPLKKHSIMDLHIAKLDKRIGTCTVLASNKWQPVYDECERLLGFSGNAASDVITAWSRIASSTYEQKSKLSTPVQVPVRRAASLNVIPRSVKTPVDLITLERARAQTTVHEEREDGSMNQSSEEHQTVLSLDGLEKSLLQMSIEHSIRSRTRPSKHKVEISGPLHLQDEVVSSYPPALDTRTIDNSTEQQPQATESGSFDPHQAIQRYIDKAFNTRCHPLGILMNHIEDVFRDSYSGIGANKFLLPHAIAEVHYIIKRLHSIIRILFPFLDGDDCEILTGGGFHRRVGVSSDTEDFVCIDSGYKILHPLVFMRLYPTLIMLYILHHVEDDGLYQSGVNRLSLMDEQQLIEFIGLPSESARNGRSDPFIESLNGASKVLININSLYTPGEFLSLFKSSFQQINLVANVSGDVLLPSVVYIIVQAKLKNLAAFIHFLTDFAKPDSEEDYILVTYEAAYKFIQRQSSGFMDTAHLST